MGLARSNVLAEEGPIEINGGIDVLHDGVGAGADPPAPHLVSHGTSTEVSPIMTESEAAPRPHAKRRPAVVVVAAIAGAAAAVYGIGALKRNAADAACAGAVEL